MDPETWTPVMPLDDLLEEELTPVDVDGQKVLLFRLEDRVFAVGSRCTHQGMPLADADVDVSGSEAVLTCPAHGSRFRLEDGRVVRPPAQAPLPSYGVRVVDGRVELLGSR